MLQSLLLISVLDVMYGIYPRLPILINNYFQTHTRRRQVCILLTHSNFLCTSSVHDILLVSTEETLVVVLVLVDVQKCCRCFSYR